MTATQPDLFATYRDTYLQVRRAHEHPGEPILYRDWIYLETIKPRGWTDDQYSAYFVGAKRVHDWYRAALDYARDARKRGDRGRARERYLERCQPLGIPNADDIVFGTRHRSEALF